MQDVTVIGVESGAILLATDSGSEFRLAVTPTLPGQVRQANPDGGSQRRISPRDVQMKIRGGLNADQVAETMGVDVDYVRRFEGPVLAERAFVLDAARRVPVTPSGAGAPDSFGGAIDARLVVGDAVEVTWSTWKHPDDGWHVQVRFTVGDVEHDARWRFDAKTSTLTPDNSDAHRLSDSDEDEGLSPRLRAVETTQDDTDSTRFDSGAFQLEAPDETVVNPEVVERQPLRAPLPRVGTVTVEERLPGNETADLLEALRRRRGERESAAFSEQPDGEQRTETRRSSISLVDLPAAPEAPSASDREEPHERTGYEPPEAKSADREDGDTRMERKKRARRSMPSWDEIVFGTRSDDDLA